MCRKSEDLNAIKLRGWFGQPWKFRDDARHGGLEARLLAHAGEWHGIPRGLRIESRSGLDDNAPERPQLLSYSRSSRRHYQKKVER
jgi:hypothetical protein